MGAACRPAANRGRIRDVVGLEARAGGAAEAPAKQYAPGSPPLKPQASKYAMDSQAPLGHPARALLQLKADIGDCLDAFADEEDGVALAMAREGRADSIASGLLAACSQTDLQMTGDGLRALHLLWALARESSNPKECAEDFFSRNTAIIPRAREVMESPYAGQSAMDLLADAAGASAESAHLVLDGLGADGMLQLFAQPKDKERAYAIVANMSQWPALRESIVGAGYHHFVLRDLRDQTYPSSLRRLPARVLASLAAHVPAHPILEEAGAPPLALELSRHADVELAAMGFCAMIGFMQSGKHRQRYAASLDRAADATKVPPLAAPALRCLRLVASDAGRVNVPPSPVLTPWGEGSARSLRALRDPPAEDTGEAVVARLLADSGRVQRLVEAAQAEGPDRPSWPAGADAAAVGGAWEPSDDAAYCLAAATASDAALGVVLANFGACLAIKAAAQSKLRPKALQARCRAATRRIELEGDPRARGPVDDEVADLDPGEGSATTSEGDPGRPRRRSPAPGGGPALVVGRISSAGSVGTPTEAPSSFDAPSPLSSPPLGPLASPGLGTRDGQGPKEGPEGRRRSGPNAALLRLVRGRRPSGPLEGAPGSGRALPPPLAMGLAGAGPEGLLDDDALARGSSVRSGASFLAWAEEGGGPEEGPGQSPAATPKTSSVKLRGRPGFTALAIAIDLEGLGEGGGTRPEPPPPAAQAKRKPASTSSLSGTAGRWS